MTDTAPEIADLVRKRMMALSGEQRFLMGARMFEAARTMVLASLPPNLSSVERREILYHRLYGEALPHNVQKA
ncbi:hypothetical protein N8642_03555 [bacterium]|jgi:hypothetical protein|nr:hypothetical protein [Verrucomicrobiota bacterium]MDA7645415.1 hypothetical protein [bacterium]